MLLIVYGPLKNNGDRCDVTNPRVRLFSVHSSGGEHVEPDDAVDRPVRVHQTPAAQPAAPGQARGLHDFGHIGRVDGGRGGVGTSVRRARPPTDDRHAVDAVLRGVLRSRGVRRAVGRGGVQSEGRQPDAVHHVLEGGRGPRTAAFAHANHDSRVQTGHTGGVHTKEHRRAVQGKPRWPIRPYKLLRISTAFFDFSLHQVSRFQMPVVPLTLIRVFRNDNTW